MRFVLCGASEVFSPVTVEVWFVSHWLEKWPITELSKANPKQPQNTLDPLLLLIITTMDQSKLKVDTRDHTKRGKTRANKLQLVFALLVG